MNSLHPVNLIKKVFPREEVGEQKLAVTIGDTYEQCDDSLSLWVVERISQVSASRFPLVSLARVGHPDIKKTVSLSALIDRHDYRVSVQ